MEWDDNDDEQMLRAIAISLGENGTAKLANISTPTNKPVQEPSVVCVNMNHVF